MNHTVSRKTLVILGLLLALVLAISARATFAGKDEDLDKGGGEVALACQVGRGVRYDYDAVFEANAEVASMQEAGHNSATLSASAEVAVTAISKAENRCTYAVAINEVSFVELVNGEVAQVPRSIPESMSETFYFTQQLDGPIVDVTVDRGDMAEIVNFKRGFANAFNITIRGDESYEVTESDNSGMYRAHYETETGRETFKMTRTKDESDYVAGPDGRAMSADTGMTQTTSVSFNVQNGLIQEVSIDECVTIDEPQAGDPAISDTYWEDELWVCMSANVQMQESDSISSNRVNDMVAQLESDEMVRMPVSAEVTVGGDYNVDNSEVTANLLHQIESNPRDGSLLNQLVMATRADANGVSQLEGYLEKEKPTGRMVEAVAGTLVGIGTAEAQAVVQEHFIDSADVHPGLQRNVMVMASTLQEPTPALVDAIAAIAHNDNETHWETATLVLGALLNRLAISDSDIAASHVADLESALRANRGDAVELLYLRALGNAGQDSSLQVVSPYLSADDFMLRMTAVESMRKMRSTQVEALLHGLLRTEEHRSVIIAIASVQSQRGNAETNAESQAMMDIILDESWERVFGNNTANATLYAYALVEDEPLLVDFAAGVRAELFNNEFDVIKAQILTEKTSDTERRFYAGLVLMDNDVASFDETVTCAIDEEHTLWDASIPLFSLTTPPIPIGPLTLNFTLDANLNLEIVYFFSLSWCDITSADAQLGVTPSIAIEVDGYATLTLAILRGGIGIKGDLIKVGVPVYFTAEMQYQTGIELCFKIDVELDALDMELYAWAQYWLPFKWRPDPRPNWTLWEFQLVDQTYNWYEYCTDNPGGGDLHCIPHVNWWDDTVIDAWWDNANCVVASPPAGSTPFIANNAYYIEADTSCPAGMPWDGTGCEITTFWVPPWILHSFWVNSGVPTLAFYMDDVEPPPEPLPIPPCPQGTTQIGYAPESFRTCAVSIPSGYTANDIFMQGNTLYVNGSASCIEGIADTTGCWLGNAPSGTNAFYYPPTNGFYYSEP